MAFYNLSASKMVFVGLHMLLLSSVVSAVVWRDCGSETGKIVSFKAENCHQRHRCDLTPGSNQTIELQFETLAKSHTLQVQAFGVIGGRTSQFAMKNRDVCRYDLPCPLEESRQYTYRTSVFIDPKFPRVAMVVKWELKDDQHKNVVCIMVPAKIL